MPPITLTGLHYKDYPDFPSYLHTILNSDKSIMLMPDNTVINGPDHLFNTGIVQDGREKSIGLFSSGTTAAPKAILNSKDRLLLNARRSADAFGVTASHRLMFLAKPWHVAGLSWAMMAHKLNAPYRLIHTIKGQAPHWAEQIREFRPDYVFTVPAVLKQLHLTAPEWFVPNIVYGGYALRETGYNFIKDHCKTIYNGYGQTEAGGLISVYKRTASEPVADNEYLCCGLPVKGVQLKGNGTPGRPEEIYLKSETAFTNEYYDTGDLGYFDNQGRVYITGRAE